MSTGAVDFAKNSNTPAIQTSAGTAIAAVDSGNRRGWAIQNVGTNPLFVRLGTGASTTLFHHVLKGGTGNDDGLGGSIDKTDGGVVFQGEISVAGTSPRFVVTEIV